jgi:hypothetical protein
VVRKSEIEQSESISQSNIDIEKEEQESDLEQMEGAHFERRKLFSIWQETEKENEQMSELNRDQNYLQEYDYSSPYWKADQQEELRLSNSSPKSNEEIMRKTQNQINPLRLTEQRKSLISEISKNSKIKPNTAIDQSPDHNRTQSTQNFFPSDSGSNENFHHNFNEQNNFPYAEMEYYGNFPSTIRANFNRNQNHFFGGRSNDISALGVPNTKRTHHSSKRTGNRLFKRYNSSANLRRQTEFFTEGSKVVIMKKER